MWWKIWFLWGFRGISTGPTGPTTTPRLPVPPHFFLILVFRRILSSSSRAQWERSNYYYRASTVSKQGPTRSRVPQAALSLKLGSASNRIASHPNSIIYYSEIPVWIVDTRSLQLQIFVFLFSPGSIVIGNLTDDGRSSPTWEAATSRFATFSHWDQQLSWADTPQYYILLVLLLHIHTVCYHKNKIIIIWFWKHKTFQAYYYSISRTRSSSSTIPRPDDTHTCILLRNPYKVACSDFNYVVLYYLYE